MHAFKVILLSALTAAALAAAPAPASAGPHWHGGGGGGWHGGGGGWHGGGWHGGYWGGPGLVFGLAGAAIAAGVIANESCVRYEPVYDNFGNVVGRRRLWTC